MKIALALIVKGTDDEAKNLANCLSYAASDVDGIFITITHLPGEAINQAVKEVAELYQAQVSEFEWCKDFAKARNFNFSQVPKEYDYILWCDADDGIRGLDKLRATIEANPADAYTMFYMYAFDEQKNPIIVHHKTRVIKNDGCVEWVGRLHEDFKNNRLLNLYHIDGIEVLHLSNPERFESAKVRNLEVAQEQLVEEPEDPRSYWNLANCLFATGRYEETLEAYNTFLSTSRSDDEKYIARLRKGETLWLLDRKQEAVEQIQTAIGIKPEFPDAYFTLASFYTNLNRLQKAAELYLTGLIKPRPYYKIIVYNPREYDFVPMTKLANVYFQLSRPDLALPLLEGALKIQPDNKQLKEAAKKLKVEVKKFDEIIKLIKKLQKITDKDKLRRELDKIPDDFKSHPGICNLRNLNFTKTVSSGRDIIIYCGFTDEQWTPDTIRAKGIGGSEEAVFHLSQLWTKAGWNVTVYNNCGFKEEVFDGVTYKPYWTWNYQDKQDAVIIWRTPIYCDFEINSPKIYIDMHDVIPAGEFTESRLKKITKVFVKSKFQRELFPQIPDSQIEIIPNGILPEKFDEQIERDKYLIVNTSAPNRGIAVLTEMFKDIKAAVPQARLQWAYGWGTFDAGFQSDDKVTQWKKDLQKKMKEYGVEELGRLNHDEVAKLYLKANVWAYPSGFGEIDCISLSKALAAGAFPVTTDFAALKEKEGHGGFFIHSDLTPDSWAKPNQFDFSIVDEKQIKESTEKIIKILQNPPSEGERQVMRTWAKSKFDWKNIAAKWLEELEK